MQAGPGAGDGSRTRFAFRAGLLRAGVLLAGVLYGLASAGPWSLRADYERNGAIVKKFNVKL